MSDEPVDDPTRRALERLATRGTPRGADAVWRDAKAGRPEPTLLRRMVPSLSIAAALGLVVALVAVTNGSETRLPTRGGRGRADLPMVPIDPELAAESRLIGFRTCDELLAHLRAEAHRTMTPYGIPGSGAYEKTQLLSGAATGGVAEDRPMAGSRLGATDSFAAPATTMPNTPPAVAQESNGTVTHSQTNVQEQGVDEPDIVKTDGDRIFIADKGMEVVAVDARTGAVLAQVPLDGVGELLLSGDRLLAFSAVRGAPMPLNGGGRSAAGQRLVAPPQQRLRLTVFDVSDRSRLQVVSHTDVDGHYVSARMIGGVARVVTGSGARSIFADFVSPATGDPADAERALAHNRRVVSEATLSRWLPHRTLIDADGIAGASEPLVECDDVYRPAAFGGLGMLSVLTIDPASPEDQHTTTLIADGETVYASGTSLYVATTRWQDPAAQTPPTPDGIRTMIHQFAIDDPDSSQYLASGSVEGTMLNQFSMSEHAGVLRVATTSTSADFTTESAVVVLNRQGDVLAEVGRVGGLGRTERIYAVRFMGDTGYVVTFRQVDPLYTLDLRDPTAPRVAGELKILGYSAYLHPVGPGLLLGVGQDATEQGMRLGTQVSLFDVSDPAAPRLLHRHPLGQGGSTVEYDHRAFLWWGPSSLALLPVSIYDTQPFSGVVGLRVASSGIAEVGRADLGGAGALRSVVVEDRVVVIGPGGVSVVRLDDLTTIARHGL